MPTALVRSTCLDPAVPFCDFSEYPQPIFDPSTGTQFTNNQIPRNRISSQAVNLLTLLPGPNVAGAGLIQNFITSGTELFNDDDFNIRIDHNASEKLNLFGRYSFADFRHHAVGAFGPVVGGPGLSPDTFAGQSLARNQSIAVGANYVLKPSLLIDFRFGFFRYHVNVVPNDLGTTPAKDAGIPGVNLGDILTSGMPIVFVDGQQGDQFFFGHICGCPLLETEQQFQWVSNWAKTVGNHIFKWGADFRYAQNLRVASTNSRTGSFAFFNSGTQGPTGGGSGLATFLLGDVSSFSRFASSIDDAGERQKRWFFYGQDTFRVTRKLVLNYGLRWEIYFPQSVTGKGAGGWVDLDTGLVNVAGFGNINLQGNVKNNFTNFAPRLGIAYQATSKTVVRLGYGRSFDLGVFGSNFGHTATQNLPVLVAQQVNPSFEYCKRIRSLARTARAPFPHGPRFGAIPASRPGGRFCAAAQDASPYAGCVEPDRPTGDHAYALVVSWLCSQQRHPRLRRVIHPNYDPNQATIVGFGSLDTNQRKPFFKKFGWTQPLQYFGSDASDSYNSLQVVADKRFTRGYQFLAHYTWSKALGYDPDYYAIDPKLNYGVSSTDRKHVFVLTNLLELPVGKGKALLGSAGGIANRIVGGWSLSGTMTWESGLAFSPSYANCGADRDTGPCRPNLVGSVHVTGNRDGYFTTTGGVPLQPNGTPGDTIGPWQRPAVGTFGSAGRNSLRGPGFFQADVSVAKNISLKESSSIQFRADIFRSASGSWQS